MLLHNLPDVKEFFEALSLEKNIEPQIIEKDYWLMHSLWGLSQEGFQFELKGGTSLSKGFHIINRFSEDVDIRFEPPKDQTIKFGKNHTKKNHIKQREDYFNWLASEITIRDIKAERDHSYDDSIMRNAGIILKYNSEFQFLPELKSHILLEVGFDNTAPNESVTISSWAYDKAIKLALEIEDNRAKNIICYLPEYTFVEKLQTISTKYRKQQDDKIKPVNFLRHYYDVFQLLHQKRVTDFIGTDKYYDYKNERFRTSDEKDLTKNEAFILSDPITRQLYAKEYESKANIYFHKQIPFDQILATFSDFLEKM